MRRSVHDRSPAGFVKGRRTGSLDALAISVSRLTYPTIFCIPFFLVVSAFFLPWPDGLITFLTCILFATVLPMAVVLAWIKRTAQDSMNVPQRESRKVPLVLCVLNYLIGTTALAAMGSPLLITGLMFCYFSNTLFVFLVNLRWKISIHSMGVAGPVVAMVFAFGYPGLILGILIPLVMWSRVRLGQHTVAQVLAGAGFGVMLTALQLSVIL